MGSRLKYRLVMLGVGSSFTVALLGSLSVLGEEPAGSLQGRANNGGMHSLRGRYEIDETNPSEAMKQVPRDRRPYATDYIFQPPLIPHTIRGYELSKNANKCLSCHSFKMSVETGATRISVTHFESREGEVLADVSPRRYFCLQCHVEQADADPLTENTFRRVESLR